MANLQPKPRKNLNSKNGGQYPLWADQSASQRVEPESTNAGLIEEPKGVNPKQRKKRYFPPQTDIVALHAHAEGLGGLCLSESFLKANTHYSWKCSEGHIWSSTWGCVKNGSWCHECRKWQSGRNRRKYSIEDLKSYAQKKGGDCLSTEYTITAKSYDWICASGHTWKAKWGNILTSKTWCPYCSSGTGERICRTFFEQLFNTEFPKVKPTWLVVGEKSRLELDGYSERLAIAFEHQGTQHSIDRRHFKDTNYGTTRPSNLAKIQERDARKVTICRERGILLIQVPSILEQLGIENVKQFIKEQLLQNHYPLPANFDKIEVDPDLSFNFNKLLELKEIAESKGGELLSEVYIGLHSKYQFKCNQGHTWYSKGDNIKQGKWCKVCAGIDLKTIEDMYRIAEGHGGKCLSDTYINNRTKLEFECKAGHRWFAVPANVLSKGSWCKQCGDTKRGEARRKYAIADLQKFAESKGGRCHSTVFTSTSTASDWECSGGHTWSVGFVKLLQGSWCPQCAKNARKNIQDLHEVAKTYGGFCLSEEYSNIKAKYQWKCGMGHVWTTSAERIFNGKWCYQCIKAKKKQIGTALFSDSPVGPS